MEKFAVYLKNQILPFIRANWIHMNELPMGIFLYTLGFFIYFMFQYNTRKEEKT